jgi:hypothetical protein
VREFRIYIDGSTTRSNSLLLTAVRYFLVKVTSDPVLLMRVQFESGWRKLHCALDQACTDTASLKIRQNIEAIHIAALNCEEPADSPLVESESTTFRTFKAVFTGPKVRD